MSETQHFEYHLDDQDNGLLLQIRQRRRQKTYEIKRVIVNYYNVYDC